MMRHCFQKTTSMQLVDTHCHIHDSEFDFKKPTEQILHDAQEVGVDTVICVGTDEKSSLEAVEFSRKHKHCHPTVALHPHEAAQRDKKALEDAFTQIQQLAADASVVAIGECGLDYYYHKNQDAQAMQKWLFRQHIELALSRNLPLVFHIRDAFADFFDIIDEYDGIRGVVHSFTGSKEEVQGVVNRGLYVGLNGIMTFTKDQNQLDAARSIPIEHIVVETDAPFLTPTPYRGKINEPKHVILITQFLSELRGESQALLAKQTSKNAKSLFNI